MSAKKFTTLAVISLFVIGALSSGCDNDNHYDERTVIYVSNINDGFPFIADVLDQGEELLIDPDDPSLGMNTGDDFIMEDWMKVQFHNRPYNNTTDAAGSSLGDFLVTSYDVEFTRLDGVAGEVVPAFTGQMSLLVPADALVESYILLVPYIAKTASVLADMQYGGTPPTPGEIITHALITFHGHEIQTERDIDFSAGATVTFVDVVTTDDLNQH